jgi:hypothetical protein|tara:strand:+ start:646 stop:915 length:270 start_codon:yes stop_codon:yes gene_type:complete
MSKQKKTAICKLSGEEFLESEIYSNGYSRFHFKRYIKMKNYAKTVLNRNFRTRDYRKVFGYTAPTKTSGPSDEEVSLLEAWSVAKTRVD